MKYCIGDIVRFQLGSGEVQEGDVQFIEKRTKEDILYINGFCRWAFKVPEKRIISRIPARYKF